MTSPGYGTRKMGGSSRPGVGGSPGAPGPEADGQSRHDHWINEGWRRTAEGHEFRLVAEYEYFSTDSRMRWFLLDFGGYVDTLVLQLPFKSDIGMRLRKQGKYDSWAIEKSISSEVQLGDPAFDADFFIDCDDQTEVFRVLGDADDRRTIQEVFDNWVTEIKIDSEGVYVVLEPGGFLKDMRYLRDAESKKKIERLVFLLQNLVAKYEPHKGEPWYPSSILFNFGVMLGAAILIRKFGKGVGCLSDGFRCDVVPYQSVFWPYLIVALLISVFVWWAWLNRKPRRANLHRKALKGAALNLVFLVVLWPVYTGLNRAWAAGDKELVQAHVLDKFERGVRHNYRGARHVLIVADWRGGDGYLNIEVPIGLYEEAVPEEHCLELRLQEGAFGYTVIGGMKVLEVTEDGGCPVMGKARMRPSSN